jgi:hypothetical protein
MCAATLDVSWKRLPTASALIPGNRSLGRAATQITSLPDHAAKDSLLARAY